MHTRCVFLQALSEILVKTVIEALLTHRNIDPKTYFTESPPRPIVTKKRKRKTPISAETVNEEDEEDQAGDDSDAGIHDQPVLAHNSSQNDEGGHNNNAGAMENINENNNANVEMEAYQYQQQQQPTLDPSGRWYWDYFHSQWFPNYPPQAEPNNIDLPQPQAEQDHKDYHIL